MAFLNLTAKVRKALDDIAPGVSETFSDNVNAEIGQAVLQAAEMVVMEAPVHLLVPTVKISADTNLINDTVNHKLTLPSTAIRLVELKMADWSIVLREFLDPASDEAKMQRSSWGCGSIDKPKAMVTFNNKVDEIANSTGRLDVFYWSSAGTLGHIAYVEKPTGDGSSLVCAVKDILEKNIIYRACQIFLEGKKEAATAEKFAALAQIY